MAHWLTMVLANGTYNGQRITSTRSAAARYHPADRLEPAAKNPRCAGRFLRLRVQRVGDHVGGALSSATPGAFDLGAATNFVVLPSADIGIIALTNAAPSGVPETLTAEFMDLVQYGQVREDWATLYRQRLRR